MKEIILCVIAISLFAWWSVSQPLYLIKVRIHFCDSRSPIVVEYKSVRVDLSIQNYKQAVPTYYGYYNVCQVDLITKTEIK